MCRLLLTIVSLILGIANPCFLQAETVAYWRFENGIADASALETDSIFDASGNNLNGTPVNGPIYRANIPSAVVPQTGATNSLSLDFDGTSQRVFIPDNTMFQLTRSFTLEGFIYLRSQPTYGGPIICRGDDRTGRDPYGLFINPDTFGVWICSADNQPAYAESHYSLTLDMWHHFAGTLDNTTGQLAFYLDGVLVDATTTTVRPFAQLDPNSNPGLGIGSVQSDTYDEHLNGMIDEVRISDVALTPSQFLNAVPEPSTFVLLGIGIFTTLAYTWRRRIS